MKIGLVTDIHEAIAPLERALKEFRQRGVECVISLGDACDTFSPVGHAPDVVRLLREAAAVGVWGNHDVGLCFKVSERLRQRAGCDVLDYMATMHPYLALADCHFSHVEPWLDARKVEQLWYYEGPPDTVEKAQRSFAAVPERYLFIGHFHRWLVMTPAGRLDWNGEGPLSLTAEPRYLVVIAPVMAGWCATFDTETAILTPIRCTA